MRVDIHSRLTMYSVNKEGQVIRHQLMIDKDSKEGKQKLQKYINRGFTFEEPVIVPVVSIEPEEVKEETYICPECSKPCKSELGLSAHMRVHKE